MNETAADGTPVFDAKKYKLHARQIVGRDGKTRTEKRPITGSRRMVDPAGNVCWVPLYAGPTQFSEGDPYRVSIQIAKAKDGWILYGECPKNSGYTATKHLPEAMRNGPPCTVGSHGEPVSDKDACKCVEAIIKARAETQAKKMKALEGNAKTAAEAQLEETRKLNEALVGAVQQLAGNKPEKAPK